MSDFVRLSGSICTFNGSDSWVILSPIEQSIKNKIESVGTPLRDWNINIYRGVLTGYNEAFIIDTAKREEILANCKTEDVERDILPYFASLMHLHLHITTTLAKKGNYYAKMLTYGVKDVGVFYI